jgi:hypothetical protein
VVNTAIARSQASGLLLAVTLSVTTAEFIEIQALPVEALRARFGLGPSCQPAVTALTTDASASQMSVAIECRPDSAAPPEAARPSGERSRPSGTSGKGS